MTPRSAFRQAALDRLASPERLDELLHVTGPRAWLVLSAAVLLLATLVGWGFAGRINTRLVGQGMLLGGDVYEVVPRWDGRVVAISVGPGDEVARGELVAELEQPELAQAIALAQARLRDLEQEDAHVREVGARERVIQRAYYAGRRTNLERLIAEQEQLLELVQTQLNREQQLLEQGLIPAPQLITAHEDVSDARARLAANRAELTQVRLDELRASFVIDQRLIASEQAVHAAQREVLRLEHDLALQSRVHAPFGGRVLELVADEGSVVSAGQPLLRIAPVGGETGTLRVLAYVGGVDAKRVEQGMQAQVAPSVVRPEEFGYIVGRVERVSEFPATADGMERVLKNDRLVDELSAAGTVFEVHLTLERDPTTASGYRWSSGRGPDIMILDGTPVTARIIVQRRRPVQLVIPGLRRIFGLY